MDQSVREFLAMTASKSPTPGGGSVAALAGALAAGLAEMALQYTVGKKAFAEHRAELLESIERLRKAGALMQDLIYEDIEAYGKLSGFLRFAEDERLSMPEYLPTLTAAIRAPEAVGGLAYHILEMCVNLLEKCNPALLSDLGIAATLAHATVHAAELNVLVNLRLLPDAEEAKQWRRRMEELAIKSEVHWRRVRDHMRAKL